MHLLLTDRLTCPRCGPAFGLILLADRLEERRVLEGGLGCPNCRERYPIAAGFADLRPPPREPLPEVTPLPPVERADTERVAALLGVTDGPGHLALLGSAASHATALADLLPSLEIVAIDPRARADPEREGVSRMASLPHLPFRPTSFRGIVAGPESAPTAAAAVGLLGPAGRVVACGADGDVWGQLEGRGLRVLEDEAGWMVGLRETP